MALYTARNLRDADLRDAPFHVDGTRTRTVIFDAGYPDMARRALATYLWRHGGLAAACPSGAYFARSEVVRINGPAAVGTPALLHVDCRCRAAPRTDAPESRL